MDMSQYLEMFLEESKEHLQNINTNILELEEQPNDISIVQEIFRSAHTLKGMAGSMGFTDMVNLTHDMENVLDLIRNEKIQLNSAIIDVILQCVDLLEGMVSSISEGGDGSCNVEEVVQKLKQIVSGDFSSETQTTVENNTTDGKKLQLEDYHINLIQQSVGSGFNAYWIKTVLEKTCQLKAARAYMVTLNLEQIGEIIASYPTTKEIEEDKFGNEFELLLLSDKSEDEVQKKVNSVLEIEKVEIEKLQVEDLSNSNSVGIKEETNVQKETSSEKKTTQEEHKKKPVTSKSIRVDVEKLDGLMNLFGQLVIDKGRLEQIAMESENKALTETVEHISRISNELQSLVLSVRMVPIDQVFNRFPRMVRDLSKELGKQVKFTVEGAETELDRTFVDEISDPLVHIIRNSLDHGIETP